MRFGARVLQFAHITCTAVLAMMSELCSHDSEVVERYVLRVDFPPSCGLCLQSVLDTGGTS